jgi:hypothetical protein
MAEQLFFHRKQSNAIQPSWPEQERSAIQLQWIESVAQTIQIRFQHVGMATRVCRISFKPVYRQAHDPELLLGVGARRFYNSRPERRKT